MTEFDEYIRKRRVPRRSFYRKIGVLGKGNYRISQAQEIGEGGLLFTSQEVYQVGQKIVVTFSIPGFVHAVARGVVRYGKKVEGSLDTAYGIQFETIDFQAKRKIRSFVAQKPSQELSAV
jgi:hypothetical protein